MKSFPISETRSLTVFTHGSSRRSARTILQFLLLGGLLWNVASLPIQAESKAAVSRTEESEKCEWLGVCDSSEMSSIPIERTDESEQCTWLGICD